MQMREQQQQERYLEKNDEVTSEEVKIRGFIEERRNTARRDKQHLKEVNKQIRKCIRDKNRSRRQEKTQRIFEEFRGIKNIACIQSAKKEVFIPKVIL